MSYNTIAEAEALIGETFTQVQLNTAQQIIHRYSRYRWESTSLVNRFSSDGVGQIFLNMPVTALTYLKAIDEENSEETTLTRFDDYDYNKKTGLLVFTRAYLTSLLWRYDFNDFEVSYTYGFVSGDEFYGDHIDMVKSAEARLALLYKKNPLRLKNINLGGDGINFNVGMNEGSKKAILADVPRRPRLATYDTKIYHRTLIHDRRLI